jgi:putative MFS transporter
VNGKPSKYAQRGGLFGLSRFHTKLLWVSGIGWMFDAMDIGLLSFVLPSIITHFKANSAQAGLIASFTFLGMFAGAAIAGSLADRFGRKAVFQWTLVLYAIGTGLSAISWDLTSLLVFRLIAGLGLGGELPVASTLVSEWSPAKTRGRMLVLLESFWAVGWALAALIAYLIVPRLPVDTGWRVAFALGALPALYVLYTRRALPESPRYLVTVGRYEEAQASIRMAGRMAGDMDAVPQIDEIKPIQASVSQSARWSSLFSGILARRTLMLWVLWFGMVFSYYGIFTWLPTILASNFQILRGLEYNLIITLAQIPGYFTAAWLVDRLGRRYTLSLFLVGSAVGAFLFRNATTPEQVVIYGCVISFFALGAWGVIYTYTPELYPTRIRAWGSGVAAAVGRLGGIIGPFVTATIIGTNPSQNPAGVTVSFIMFTVIFLAIAANVFFLGEETKGRSLEEIAATPSPQPSMVASISET